MSAASVIEMIRGCKVCGKPVMRIYGDNPQSLRSELLADAAVPLGRTYRCFEHPENGRQHRNGEAQS